MSDDQIKALREREPVAWLAYFSGCGSVNSQTFLSRRKEDAQAWKNRGAEVTPLYADPPHLTDLEAENTRLKARLAEALEALEPFASVALLDQTPDAPRGMWVSVPFGWLQDARRVREGGKV